MSPGPEGCRMVRISGSIPTWDGTPMSETKIDDTSDPVKRDAVAVASDILAHPNADVMNPRDLPFVLRIVMHEWHELTRKQWCELEEIEATVRGHI